MKPVAKIYDYEIEKYPHGYVLTGSIGDHPRQTDFLTNRQVTSPVKIINFQDHIAETENTIYELIDGPRPGRNDNAS